MNEAKQAAERLVKYFDSLGTDEEVENYDPAEDAHILHDLVRELYEVPRLVLEPVGR